MSANKDRLHKPLAAVAFLAVMTASAVLCFFCGGIKARSAYSEAELSAPKTVAENESFTVTVSFSADEIIGSVKASLDYDSDVIEFVSGDFANGGGGLCTINGWSESPEKTARFVLTFKALKSGSSQLVITSSTVLSYEGDLLGANASDAAAVTVVSRTEASSEAPVTDVHQQTSETAPPVSEPEHTEVQTASETSKKPQTVSAEGPESLQPEAGTSSKASSGASFSSSEAKDSNVSADKKDMQGAVTAILLVLGCVVIVCLLLASNGGSSSGKRKKTSRRRK